MKLHRKKSHAKAAISEEIVMCKDRAPLLLPSLRCHKISSTHLSCLHVYCDCHKIIHHSASEHWPPAREQELREPGWHAATQQGSKSQRQVEAHAVCTSHAGNPNRVSSDVAPQWSAAFQTLASPWRRSGPGDPSRNCWLWKWLGLYFCHNRWLGLYSVLLNKILLLCLKFMSILEKSTWE